MKRNVDGDQSKPQIKCHICFQVYKRKFELNSHLFSVHKALPPRFVCSKCPETYYRTDCFANHLQTHKHDKSKHTYVCDHCNRGFVDKRNLINHLSIHDDVDIKYIRHFCADCPASFCEARLLYYHIKKNHLNKEQFTQHLNRELNETWMEPVKNTTQVVQITKIKNNVLTIQKYKKKADIESHYGVNLYQQFKASELKTKINHHYSKVVCDYCKKQMLKKSIAKHIKETHLKIKKFHCNVCKRSFNRHYQLCDHRCGARRRRSRIKEE